MKSTLFAVRGALMLTCVVTFAYYHFRDSFRSKRIHSLRGTIESVDPARRILAVRSAEATATTTFTWQPETIFLNLDGRIACETVKPGERVRVSYTADRGCALASQIEIEPVYQPAMRGTTV